LLSSTLNFGTVALGQTSTASAVTLTNGTSTTLTISGTSIGLDFIVVSTTCSSSLAAGQSCAYMLAFRPLTAGSKSETFRVNDSSADSPQKVQLLGVAGKS
jgi:hypothetical protein